MLRLLLIVLVGFCVLGCEDETSLDAVDAAGPAVEDAETVDYRFFLMTAARADTLTGSAQFGIVLNRRVGANELVIQLGAAGGYGGGLYISRQDTTLPAPGTYEVGDAAAENLAPDRWTVSYQAGLGTQLTSSSGRIVFETVEDTLIIGSIDVILQGTVARGGVEDPLDEAQVRGRFRADRGMIGYMIGL